jgi:hypothetical protein
MKMAKQMGNPNHVKAGSPEGGQFTSGSGGGGGKTSSSGGGSKWTSKADDRGSFYIKTDKSQGEVYQTNGKWAARVSKTLHGGLDHVEGSPNFASKEEAMSAVEKEMNKRTQANAAMNAAIRKGAGVSSEYAISQKQADGYFGQVHHLLPKDPNEKLVVLWKGTNSKGYTRYNNSVFQSTSEFKSWLLSDGGRIDELVDAYDYKEYMAHKNKK